MKPAYYNEIDPYCCRVLRKQIAAGNLPPGDVDERDIRDVRASDLAGYGQIHLFAGIGGIPLGLRMAGMADDFPIITGGFPCQDISEAGQKKGIDGDRSGLWSDYKRIIRNVRPRYVLVENVSALLVRGIDRVLGDLAEIGYDCEWECLPASSVGAPHRRDRVFIVAYAARVECRTAQVFNSATEQPYDESARQGVWGSVLGVSNRRRLRAIPDSRICRVVDGLPPRMDRIRGLGNAVVPQVVAYIGRRIMEAA